MKRLARTLELSVATNSSWATQADRDTRRAALSALPNTAERKVGLALDTFAAKHTELAAVSLSGLARLVGGVSYLGNGALASVYKKGDEVLKVYRQTAFMSEQAQKRYATEQEITCNTFSRNLGAIVISQSFGIETHPLGTYQVVVGRQAYTAGQSLDLFTTNTCDLNRPSIAAFCERQGSAQPQLTHLVEQTFTSSDSSGLVPDLNGHDNLRLVGSNEQLTIIDAQPIDRAEHPGVHDLILKQAETLNTFLSVA